MRKFLVLIATMMFAAAQISAAPVDVNTVKVLLAARNVAGVEHVYTLNSDEGTPYLYVFNYENGYVVVAADDRAYPVLGYSDEGQFDADNIPDGMKYFFGHYGRQIQYAIDNDLVAEDEITAQWERLRKEGVNSFVRAEKAVNPLIATQWNQDNPYNYYAPTAGGGPGGHCYAGCVATAMSQVMKFWNWPETGVGEHSYSSSTYGGTLSANFGATTYNWSIMPNSCSGTGAASLAVALLMYHCGIAVDMDYAPNGSGAHTEDVADAVKEYFRYGAGTYVDARDNYTRLEWEDKLIEQLDRNIPLVYAGSDPDGGHAFNCDGYNNQRYFHFNFGWSGWNNNYFQIDAINTYNGSFNLYQRAVFDMIPDYIYNVMVPTIETLQVSVADAMTKTVTVSFQVPAVSESGEPLESIAEIRLKRNGTLVHTFNNPQPGEEISYDDVVAEYGCYDYTICGVNNNYEGRAYTDKVVVGPNCTWKLVCSTTNFQGWNSGKLQVLGANGVIVLEVAMNSSSPVSEKFQMPEGNYNLQWVAPLSTVPTMGITLKNSANETVYSFSGASTQLSATIHSGNNDCPNCTAPTDLTGEYVYRDDTDGALLTWNCDYTPSNFKIYRSADGENYEEIAKIDNSAREYFDAVGTVGMYYYKVTAYSNACESTPAVTSGDTDFVIVEVLAVVENTIDARMYPNPANATLNIEAAGISEVVVCNTLGQVVYRFNGLADNLSINTAVFDNGIYMVNVKGEKGCAKARVIVMH